LNFSHFKDPSCWLRTLIPVLLVVADLATAKKLTPPTLGWKPNSLSNQKINKD
jgi:hypothetical protein